jgi:hypothetical protein
MAQNLTKGFCEKSNYVYQAWWKVLAGADF